MPATWKFSDGTTLQQGGIVTGAGRFASGLRLDLEGKRAGLPVSVSMWEEPGGAEQLDPSNIAVLDVWARNLARVYGVAVVDAPTYDYPPEPRGEPDEDEDEDGGIH